MSSLTLLQAALKLANQTEGFQPPTNIAWRMHSQSLLEMLLAGERALIVCPEARRPELASAFDHAEICTSITDLICPTLNLKQPEQNLRFYDIIYWEGFNKESDFSQKASWFYDRLDRLGRLVFPAILSDEEADSAHTFVIGEIECQGGMTEANVGQKLSDAGFHGITYSLVSDLPVFIQDGIEYRFFTISAYKGKAGVCLDQGHAVVYKGPWKQTVDDDGHTYHRGVRTAVCEKTFNLLMAEPYRGQFIPLRCYAEPKLENSGYFDCNTPSVRDPKVTKGLLPIAGSAEEPCCADGSSCC